MDLAVFIMIYILKAGTGYAVYGISAYFPAFGQFGDMAVNSGAPNRDRLIFKMFHDLRSGNMATPERSNVSENSLTLLCIITRRTLHAVTSKAKLEYCFSLVYFSPEVNMQHNYDFL